MGLRSMHEASRQQNGQGNSSMLELIDQQSRRISELEGQVSELSSKCSTLMSELQQKSETIVELNGQIEKLNGSDLVLKENERLKRENLHIAQEAENVVSSVKAEYQRKARELADQQNRAEQRANEAEKLKIRLQATIKAEAENMSKSRRKSLENEYQAKKAGYESVMIGSLLYGVLCTVFTAWKSETFVDDFKAFFVAIWSFLCLCVEKLLEAAKWASQLGDKIPQPVVAAIVHWVILIAVVLLVGVGAVFLLFLAGNYVYVHYKDGYADTISLAVILISLAVAVFFAEPIRSVVPINLLLLLILVHVLYMGVRWYIKGCRRSRGYY